MTGLKYQLRNHALTTIAPLTAAVGLALASTSVSAATITVTTLDDGSVVGQCTLRDAVIAANTDTVVEGCAAGSGADEIVFAGSLAGTITLTDGVILVGSEISIAGPGHGVLSIDGNYATRLFAANGPLSLSGLTLANGHADTDVWGGGAVFASTTSLSLSDCVVTGHSSAPFSYGGAVTVASSYLAVSDCSFVNNQSATSGGYSPPRAFGGAILSLSSLITISDSQFIDNQTDYAGGALALFQSSATVSTSQFTGNQSYMGGAIGAFNQSQMELDDSIISENQAMMGGGMLLTSDAGAIVYGGQITANQAFFGGGAMLGVGTPPGETELFRGRGSSIFEGPGKLTLYGSSVSDNQALSAGGGFLAKYQSELVIIETDVHDNQASEVATLSDSGDWFQNGQMRGGSELTPGFGGGVAVMGQSSAYLIDSTLAANSAPQGGGLIVMENSIGFLVESQITGNLANLGGGLQAGYYEVEAVILGHHASDSRGGLPFPIAVAYFSSISGNQADVGGGLMSLENGLTSTKYSDISGNEADYGGGGAAFSGAMSLKYSDIRDNVAHEEGGGLVGFDCYTVVSRSTIAGNSAGGIGGGGTLRDCDLQVGYSLIADNSATYVGGLFSTGDAEIVNSTITSNSAMAIGGLFAIGLTADFMTVSHNTSAVVLTAPNLQSAWPLARGGPAFNPGGAFTVSGMNPVLINSSIFANNSGPDGDLVMQDDGVADSELEYSLVQVAHPSVPAGTGNLFAADPLLGPLADNGGLTLTRALAPTSPAIDAADPVADLDFDQRGAPPWTRVFGGRADMGAFEFFVDGIFHDRFEFPGF